MWSCGASQRLSFIRRGRHYEHIYPKLENNDKRLKPSQYFRCSKWTTSPVVDNGPQRVPDTIMCLKWESDNVKASSRYRQRKLNKVILCTSPFHSFCAAGTRREISAHCLKRSKKCKEAFASPIELFDAPPCERRAPSRRREDRLQRVEPAQTNTPPASSASKNWKIPFISSTFHYPPRLLWSVCA